MKAGVRTIVAALTGAAVTIGGVCGADEPESGSAVRFMRGPASSSAVSTQNTAMQRLASNTSVSLAAAAETSAPDRTALGTTAPDRTAPDATALEAYLTRRARSMPGISCDPEGPVYVVIDQDWAKSSFANSDHADFLIHFGASGKPDEVRIERSSGDADFDAKLARAVCLRARPESTERVSKDGGAGWALLTVHLIS